MFRTLIVVLSLLCLPFGPAAADLDLPSMGGGAAGALSVEEEQRIGDEVIREIRRQLDLEDDPEAVRYINQLGQRLVAASPTPQRHFEFFMVDARQINAFAFPGGYVGINSGLLLETETESELASVLAHEIAHVSQRHIARQYEQASRMQLPVLAGVIAAILLGAHDPQAGQAAAAATTGAAIQSQLSYSRAHEREADRIGMDILRDAGFDPRGMPHFFERMQRGSRLHSRPPEFLSTHPVTAERIADSQARAEQIHSPDLETTTLDYRFIRAKLMVKHEGPESELQQRFRRTIERTDDREDEMVARYGLARLLLADGDVEQAAEIAAPLHSTLDDYTAVAILAADIERTRGLPEAAAERLKTLMELYPDDPHLTALYVEALLEAGRPRDATDAARKQLRTTQAPQLQRWLAEAESARGRDVEMHLAMAEFYHLNGQLAAAVDQLEQAERRNDLDFYQRNRIEARLQTLQEERARQRRD